MQRRPPRWGQIRDKVIVSPIEKIRAREHENNLRSKIQGLGGPSLFSGVLERASGTLRDLQGELNRTEKSSPSPTVAQPDSAKPLPVEIHQPEPKGLEALANLVRPLLSPLA